ncbi:GlxA family transcriptional regulator [Oceanicoccus sagamiensis]|uniref:HTH araC/xylS-type domain-containing protein n=1 Tax=Oceanicoccus sagamiensis TaxID=716816 RepID=A0A1X9NDT8_9GAMM|nr:helix-turn-helix domain-containing protein [Oceanicoccus sagamiensis]ARN76200.1 hypothetical protein BST96_20095 [Oceanicoccus sagamiensis]
MTKQISVFALPQSSGAAVMGVIDIFKVANLIAERINGAAEPLFDCRVLSADGEPVCCSNGYSISVAGSVEDIDPQDILFLAAFNVSTHGELDAVMADVQPYIPWFRENGPRQSTIATSCSGSFVLAEAGLLNGVAATTSWWLSDYFAQRYPQVALDADAICTVAGNRVCGAGTTAYQDVCLSILERYAGKHFARLTAKYMMIDNQRRSQAPYRILSLIDSDDEVVKQAEGWIRANLSRDFKINEVAHNLAVSPRTLIRRFQYALGETPQAFTQKLRIEKCKVLLETTQLGFGEIVQRCGYNDESAFRRLFKRYCQLSPRDYRRRFNTATALE